MCRECEQSKVQPDCQTLLDVARVSHLQSKRGGHGRVGAARVGTLRHGFHGGKDLVELALDGVRAHRGVVVVAKARELVVIVAVFVSFSLDFGVGVGGALCLPV